MSQDEAGYKAQRSLEKRLGKSLGLDLSKDLNLSRTAFDQALETHQLEVKGLKLFAKKKRNTD
ncbi:hypothetical protein E8F20_04330 [Pseudomonas sp. BN415]|uniref:hypothetical protein n=1 Tax=Pseudomonas sp. BN415 TaxID=2567889 RepID=UPI0024576591|nr:hypothetical protein [Pseudomonas sp. BN415]MDH4581102.1 hypothetical protein [Pseudomonas sp. BN415]